MDWVRTVPYYILILTVSTISNNVPSTVFFSARNGVWKSHGPFQLNVLRKKFVQFLKILVSPTQTNISVWFYVGHVSGIMLINLACNIHNS